MNAPAKSPTVAVELDALEADIKALDDAMIAILDVALAEAPVARTTLLVALEKVHEASYSLRHWLDAEAKGPEVRQ